ADVIERVSSAGGEIGILELGDAAVARARAGDHLPRILDERVDRLAGGNLRADPDHFDPEDGLSLVRGVVALAATEALEALRTERLCRPVGAAWELLERTAGPHLESG